MHMYMCVCVGVNVWVGLCAIVYIQFPVSIPKMVSVKMSNVLKSLISMDTRLVICIMFLFKKIV